jgi:hypothetical protein
MNYRAVETIQEVEVFVEQIRDEGIVTIGLQNWHCFIRCLLNY